MATTHRFRTAFLAAAAAAALSAAVAVPGQASPTHRHHHPSLCPLATGLRAGGPERTFHGDLTEAQPHCLYSFHAAAGDSLVWTESGAAIRVVVTDPSGAADGPGVPSPYPLTKTGEYTFDVGANLMADGGFGPYSLHLQLKH